MNLRVTLLFSGAIFALFVFASMARANSSDRVFGHAWSDNIGWISFNSTDCDADGDGFADGILAGCPGGLLPTNGLVAYWNMENGSGQTATDQSDQGNDGTLGADSSVSTDDPTWISGKAGNGGALDFDESDFVEADDADSLDLTTQGTFSFWANQNSGTDTRAGIIDKQANGGSGGYQYQNAEEVGANILRLTLWNGASGSDYDSPTNYLVDGEWHYYSTSFDSSNGVRWYRDGVLLETDTWLGAASANATSLRIGQRRNGIGGNSGYFNGLLDEVRIYDRALSQEEIDGLYAYSGPVAIQDYGVDVDLSSGELSGYAWSDSVGWIQFNPAGPYPEAPSYAACIDRASVSGEDCDGAGNNTVSGWARALSNDASWDGWIKLASTAPLSYGVTWNSGTQELEGWAWGGEVVGWISFNDITDGGSDHQVVLDANTAPEAINPIHNVLDYCFTSSPPIVLSWDYDDVDNISLGADPQSAYQVQLKAGSTDFSFPDIDSDKQITTSEEYAPQALSYNTEYYWRVRVWDSKNKVSAWAVAPSSFTTDAHAWPDPSSFGWNPGLPQEDEVVQFSDGNPFVGTPTNGLCGSPWCWDFGDGNTDDVQSPTNSFSPVQSYTVKLTATDELGSCTTEKTLNMILPLPVWKEISPFGGGE